MRKIPKRITALLNKKKKADVERSSFQMLVDFDGNIVSWAMGNLTAKNLSHEKISYKKRPFSRRAKIKKLKFNKLNRKMEKK